MNIATREQVDEVIKETKHQGDTFGKVRVGEQTGWVKLVEK
jgi:hypothetical protein